MSTRTVTVVGAWMALSITAHADFDGGIFTSYIIELTCNAAVIVAGVLGFNGFSFFFVIKGNELGSGQPV